MEDKIKEFKFDMKFCDAIKTGKKTRTARPELKANPGDVVQIFDEPYVITERRIYPFGRLVNDTYKEEGFNSPEEFSATLYRIYGTDVYGSHLYSYKFTPYKGEISEQIRANSHDSCFGCPEKNLYTIPTSWGGEFYCRFGNKLIGGWNTSHKTIDVPKRCSAFGGEK